VTGAPTDLVIVGCGGHGRELFETIDALNAVEHRWNVVGFVDDAPAHLDRLDRLGARLLGDTQWLVDHPSTFVLGIGTSAVRRQLSTRLEGAGLEPATLVHPGARIGPDVELGRGVVVFHGATVTTDVRIGDHSHLNVGCSVQHDTVVGDFVQFSPGVFVNGDCTLGDDVCLGTGAIVTRGLRVGAGARIGAGAVVLGDVPDGVTVVGVPAQERS